LGTGPLEGVPISGVLGDQQAALFGQLGLEAGAAKNTYGTGCFLLLNTGSAPVPSDHGLLTTAAFRLEDGPLMFALEGSVAVAGSLVQWLRDNLGLIESATEIEQLAASVEDNGDVYFVPAFSGLFAPHWRPDARGVVVGLTRFATRGHIGRAALEATAFQTQEVVEAMRADSGIALTELRVDGGMVQNEFLMQFQADILGIPVVRPVVAETTALGAAYAAGLAEGVWSSVSELDSNWRVDRRFEPKMAEDQRQALVDRWRQAVRRTLDWV
jgi:glycerol kinase